MTRGSNRRRPGATLWLVLLLGAGLAAGPWRAGAQDPGQPAPPETQAPEGDEGEAPDEPEQMEKLPADEAPLGDKESAYREMELLTEVLLQVRRKYVEDKTYRDVVYGALHGMLSALDPHSAFLEREAYSEMRDETSGSFSGIGVTVGMREGVLTIIAPIEDTPGFRAGLQSGDQILAVDGVKMVGVNMREAIRHLRGPKGTTVVVTVRRPPEEGEHDYTIVRDDIEVSPVKGARILEGGIGYVRITQFSQPTAAGMARALEKLRGEGLQALVLDLRSNPGGLLSSAIEVAQLFLPEGELIVSTRGRPRVYDEIRNASRGKVHYVDFPMAVLVNGGTASAAEIVAGALQDHGRAVLLGETTFGKGSVQSIIPLQSDTNTALRLTVALYYTPSGRQIHEKGIEPDIAVHVPREEWRQVQLRRAREEEPKLFEGRMQGLEATNVVDRPLQRAADLLQAVRILKE